MSKHPEGVFYNNHTNMIYTSSVIFGDMILFHTELFGSMFIGAEQINNPSSGWIYLGEL